MKATRYLLLLQALVGFGFASIADAAGPSTPESIQVWNGRTYLLQGNEYVLAVGEVRLPFDIVVQTNGTFTVRGGRERTLRQGDILGRDGMLLALDGSINPVIDHVAMKNGRIIAFVDGTTIEPKDALPLPNGYGLLPDGTFTNAAGSHRLLDGELLQPEGASIPTRDTITMQNGVVRVQKDGSMLAIAPGRSIMMNEGTKVLGDGTIIGFNGERRVLNDGEILTVEGVITRRR